jgi:hypothetical protein
MNSFSCPLCGRACDAAEELKSHIDTDHPEATRFRSFIEIDQRDKTYPDLAKKLQLPDFQNGQLVLWDNEKMKLVGDRLWANLGVYVEDGNINWLLKYQSRMYGFVPISAGGPSPGPQGLFSGPDSSRTWSLRCTDNRIVMYMQHVEKLFTKRSYRAIFFPWVMLAQISFFQYSKKSISVRERKCYFSLTFIREKQKFCLVFGDLDLQTAKEHAVSLAKVALDSKIKYAQLLKQIPSWSSDAEESLSGLKEDLASRLVVEGKGAFLKQRVFTYLDPFFYYYMLRRSEDTEDRKHHD